MQLNSNYLNIPSFPLGQQQLYLGGVLPNAYSLVLAEIFKSYQGLLVVLVEDFNIAHGLTEELTTFIPKEQILHFPDWETLPFDNISPQPEIIASRLATLFRLPTTPKGILIVPMITLMHKISPIEYIKQQVLLIELTTKIDLVKFSLDLSQAGYTKVPLVTNYGEYAVRGSIIDLFPAGSDLPFRIDLFGDTVDSIRTFNIENQRTIENIKTVQILPAQEYPFDAAAIKKFRENWRKYFPNNVVGSKIYQEVSAGIKVAGLEYYLPLFFNKTASLLDYLPQNCLIIRNQDVVAAANNFWQQINERYAQCHYNQEQPALPVEQLFFNVTEVINQLQQFPTIICQQQLHTTTIEKKLNQTNTDKSTAETLNPAKTIIKSIDLDETIIEPIGINQDKQKPTTTVHSDKDLKVTSIYTIATRSIIQNYYNIPVKTLTQPLDILIQDQSKGKLFAAESKGRREILKQTLTKKYPFLKIQDITTFDQAFLNPKIAKIILTSLTSGFELINQNLSIITEEDLFPAKTKITTKKAKKVVDPELSIKNLTEINIGDPIVHLQYGVGRYLGLTILNYDSNQNEFVVIEYADSNKLYVPITNLNLIYRYSGVDIENAPLHSLSNDKWQKEKQKVTKQIKDIAAELLEIYAIRSQKQRSKYQFNQASYQQFTDLFEFTDTVDQAKASLDIINDLTNPKPMDRVICGDVGFGKTEIAMRAAFIVAENSYQIAVLAPTTLLAQQHYQTFLDRFADFPIRIELLSRFTEKSQQPEILARIANGSCDIVIGTHKLLQQNIKFKRLGLLIIDEEHRFGVEQKEKFKKLRANIDLLSLTATPIPRTLNMAISGIRDLSIIATPPTNRIAVKTFVREYSKAIIQEATMRELQRGGQVYYLHNQIETIELAAKTIQELVPYAKVQIAHAKMSKKQLEHVMIDFYHRKFNVLVCTTIIESGIDIPNANTIFIARADCFGLSQLHQLRGRVGRSDHQAYAICFIPDKKTLTKDAVKRLEALENLDSLGIGFTLATHDLEIRGSGELLGKEQSGNMHNVGFGLYLELLEQTVNYLKQHHNLTNLDQHLEEAVSSQLIEIDLQLPAFIPNDYIADLHIKLVLYKRIAKVDSLKELQELKLECIDRFGKLPQPLQNLFALNELRLLAESLGVKKIKLMPSGCLLEFKEQHKINTEKLLKLLQLQPNKFKLINQYSIKYLETLKTDVDKISKIEQLLLDLEADNS